MKKRHIIYLLALLMVSSGVYRVYQNYKPQDASIIDSDAINYEFSNLYDLDGFRRYIMTVDREVNVLFFDRNSLTSQHFFNSTLATILGNNDVKTLTNIIYVDISNAGTSSSSYNNGQFGYSAIPALANLHYTNGVIKVNSIIQDDGVTLFNTETLADWLKENGCLPQ